MIRVPLLHFLSLFFLVNLFSSIVYAENDKLNIKFLLTNGDWYGAYSGGIKTGHIFNKAELVNELDHQALKNALPHQKTNLSGILPVRILNHPISFNEPYFSVVFTLKSL